MREGEVEEMTGGELRDERGTREVRGIEGRGSRGNYYK